RGGSGGQPRVTLPALMHEVHTFIRRVVPPPAGTRTVWMLGFQRRFVRRCEWDTLWPKPGPLPQTSHTLATGVLLDRSGNLARVPDRPTPRRTAPTPAGTTCHTRPLGFRNVLDRLDAAAVRRWCAAGLDGLRRHQ